MERIADDVHRISLAPRDALNVYLVGDVLVDAGAPPLAGKILKAISGHAVTDHVVTHAHNDHVGGSAKVVEQLGLDGVGAGAADAESVRTGSFVVGPHAPVKPIARRLGGYPAVAVTRELQEGDSVGPGFQVLEVPGHSPGHIALWREEDGILIQGDVFFGMNPFTLQLGVRNPVRAFTVDPALNKASQQRLAALEPRVTAFGHGPLLRDPSVLARVAHAD